MLLGVVLTAAVAAGLYYVTKRLTAAPKTLFGVYVQPGPLQKLKEFVFWMLISYKKRKGGVTSATADHNVARPTEDTKESPQKLSSHAKAVDAVYFNGGNSEGVFMVAALARRPKGVFNGVLYLNHPSLGLLQLPCMPDTLLFGREDRWEAEGLTITPQQPMGTWAIKYNGKMRRHQTSDPESEAKGDLVQVELDITWAANYPHFDFDSDIHEGALCRSMAKEPWSKEYFNNLRDAHQTHYEQMGRLHGQAVVDGEQYTIDLLSMRDHSYGMRREWRLLHRYALHMMHTEQGTQFDVGVVSQPITCSNLELGYVCWPGQGRCSPIAEVHFDLWRHGERGTPPTDYAFSFKEGGKTHLVEVSLVAAPVFFMGWEWEARIVECFAQIKLDGVPGFGIVEYQYNSGPGDHRPCHLAAGDPDWTKTLNKG